MLTPTNQQIVRVAVDAMGGDHGPSQIVAGAVKAASTGHMHIMLVGEEALVKGELRNHSTANIPIEIIPSQGIIQEEEQPVLALRQKPDASVAIATRLVKEGKADAIVSMGPTGATMASAAIMLGLMEGLERPAIGGNFLGLAPKTVVMDMGSNVDSRPDQLLSFAILGSVFCHGYLDVQNPRVALLSVGAEEGKGNRTVKESYPLLKASGINFVGNVEGMDLFTGKADVIVCDGFVGNILLKFSQGMSVAIGNFLKERLSGVLPDNELEKIAKEVWDLNNAARKMGGPLFGVNGTVVIGHGSSVAGGVAGAIDTAYRVVKLGLIDSMRTELTSLKPGEVS